MIIKETVYIPYLKCDRTLHIYLPDNPKKEKLPVLYMFDGHNLFYDEDATYGKSWGFKKYLDEIQADLIVVGIECSHTNRMSEFSPYSFDHHYFGKVEASGVSFLKWMRTDLKKYIDNKYPTLTDKKHTYIGGSSMGGLMAIYAGITLSKTYSKAICVSTAFSFGKMPLLEDLNKVTSLKGSEFYLSFGSNETNDKHHFATMVDSNLTFAQLLNEKKAKTFVHCMVDAYHNEASWEKEVPIFLKELNII